MGHAASMSLYDYCSGDPVNNFDPDGRYWNGSMIGIGDAKARIAYTTENGTSNVVAVSSGAELATLLKNVADTGNKIVNLNITAHGSEGGIIVLGAGNNATVVTNEGYNYNTSATGSIDLKSTAGQKLLQDSISPTATVKCDVCYGANGMGIANSIKQALPDSDVSGYTGVSHIAFGIFASPSYLFPWDNSDLIKVKYKEILNEMDPAVKNREVFIEMDPTGKYYKSSSR